MKKLILLCACLLALAAPLRAAVGPPEIVVVRIRDTGGDLTVLITRGEGKSELLTFKGGVSDKGIRQSAEGYYTFLNKLYQEGYSLKGTFVNGQFSAFTTLLFVKDSPGSETK